MRNPLCDAAPFLDSDAVTVSLTASEFSQEMQRLRIVKGFLARRNSLLFSSFDVGIQICWSTPTVAGRTIYYSKHKTQLPAICVSLSAAVASNSACFLDLITSTSLHSVARK